MAMKDADNPPTARELAGRAKGGMICPKCGCGHLGDSYGGETLPGGTSTAYRPCRNCGTVFLTSQPPRPQPKIIREVNTRRKDSDGGEPELKVHRDSA